MSRILIIMHNYAGISDLIKRNLKDLHYDNIDFMLYSEEKFRYKNLGEKLTNLYRKIFLGDKKYKEKLRTSFIENTLLQKARNLPEYDTILMMTTEFFSDEFISVIRTKTKKLIGNHWDGLKRTPSVYPKLKFFDKFFVFDPDDVDEQKNIFFLTNFFITFDETNDSAKIENDVFYIGTYVEERFKALKKISETLSLKKISQKILLFSWDKREKDGEIVFTNDFLTYDENIKWVKSSKALLDLKLKEHNGLSFRFFEALKYEKKIITDNPHVKNYDFYRKENIFIIGEDSENGLNQFIEMPYLEIPLEIKNKYNFESWFKTLTS